MRIKGSQVVGQTLNRSIASFKLSKLTSGGSTTPMGITYSFRSWVISFRIKDFLML